MCCYVQTTSCSSPLSVQSQDCKMGKHVITVNSAVVIQAIESNTV